VKLQGFLDRVAPLGRKLSGQLPLCPWSAVLGALRPSTLGGHPPRFAIEEVERDGEVKRLRFGEKHFFWFPAQTPLTPELWSEYLCVFWHHPANGHYYLAPDTPVAPGDVCIDCGACEGYFAQQALEAGASRVICVEPSAQMARCLERTFAEAVKEGRATIMNAAAGAVDGACSFSFDEADPFSGRLSADAAHAKVRMATIDSLRAELGLGRVDYIKMDIEGAELQALEGALGTLRRDRPKLAITTYHRPFDFVALNAVLTSLGYRTRPVGVTRRDSATHRPVMLHAGR
jgi:FkbM family methyltransferase